MRRVAKRDDNEAEIVDALRRVGCLVERISGKGVPDLIVWSPFTWSIHLVEVKDGGKVKSARQLTEAQQAFHADWEQAPVHVVESVDAALSAVGATR